MLCTISRIDLIVPFLPSISISTEDKDCTAGHLAHLEVTTDEELTSHDYCFRDEKLLSVCVLREKFNWIRLV
jgi:hypothetical protein